MSGTIYNHLGHIRPTDFKILRILKESYENKNTAKAMLDRYHADPNPNLSILWDVEDMLMRINNLVALGYIKQINRSEYALTEKGERINGYRKALPAD